MLNIRNATLNDVNAIYNVQAQCYAIEFLEDARSFQSKIEHAADSCWVAYDEKNLVGYMVCLPVDYTTFPSLNASVSKPSLQPSMLYIHDLAIHPAYRNHQIGLQLLATLRQYASSIQLTTLALIAVQDSQDYWQKQGFKITLSENDYLNQKLASFGSNALLMTCHLN